MHDEFKVGNNYHLYLIAKSKPHQNDTRIVCT